MDDFRGRFGFTDLGAGGSVDDLPGGERASDDGSSSRGLELLGIGYFSSSERASNACGANRARCL